MFDCFQSAQKEKMGAVIEKTITRLSDLERWHLGLVVRKPVNVNPGLNVNWSIKFS